MSQNEKINIKGKWKDPVNLPWDWLVKMMIILEVIVEVTIASQMRFIEKPKVFQLENKNSSEYYLRMHFCMVKIVTELGVNDHDISGELRYEEKKYFSFPTKQNKTKNVQQWAINLNFS